MSATLGLDLGGTNMKAAVVHDSGEILASKSIPTLSSQGIRSTIDRMAAFLTETAAEAAPLRIRQAGITAPAVINSYEGIVELMPNFPDDWKGLPLAAELEKATGLQVSLLNDARAAAYGEKMFGVGRAYSDFVCITIGTGVGGGIVHNGTLLLGSRGVAGEIGHMSVIPDGHQCGCGHIGCLETVCSGPAIASAAAHYIVQGRKTQIRDMIGEDLNRLSPLTVCSAADNGDAVALRILDNAVHYLCAAIRNLIVLLNPQAVILGGGVAESAVFIRLFKEKMEASNLLFSDELGGVDIVKAELDVMAGAVGAAAWARSRPR